MRNYYLNPFLARLHRWFSWPAVYIRQGVDLLKRLICVHITSPNMSLSINSIERYLLFFLLLSTDYFLVEMKFITTQFVTKLLPQKFHLINIQRCWYTSYLSKHKSGLGYLLLWKYKCTLVVVRTSFCDETLVPSRGYFLILWTSCLD